MALSLLPEKGVLEILSVFSNDPQVNFRVEEFRIFINFAQYFYRTEVINNLPHKHVECLNGPLDERQLTIMTVGTMNGTCTQGDPLK